METYLSTPRCGWEWNRVICCLILSVWCTGLFGIVYVVTRTIICYHYCDYLKLRTIICSPQIMICSSRTIICISRIMLGCSKSMNSRLDEDWCYFLVRWVVYDSHRLLQLWIPKQTSHRSHWFISIALRWEKATCSYRTGKSDDTKPALRPASQRYLYLGMR